jgi:hypothetical protein
MTPPAYIVGIDLGDGESSLAYVPVKDHAAPTVFEFKTGERSMITAVARTSDGTLIGQEAILKRGIEELYINSKIKPADTNLGRARMSQLRDFILEFYALFREAEPEIGRQAQVYIGHPTSWTEEDAEAYRAWFPANVFPGIQVVRESHAAFIQVRDFAKLPDEFLNSVLVIDIGSSTTDITFVKDLVPQQLSLGDEFGARLIDQAIFEVVEERHLHPEQLQERWETHDKDKVYLRYLCRKAKEHYFTGEPFERPQPETASFRWVLDQCWQYVQDLDMNAVLERPLEKLPRGWKAGLRALVMQAREEIKPEIPKIVILTGGGSRMPFTRDICREVFPEPATRLNPDPDPSFAVAKGLAGYGRWRYRVAAFLEAIHEFCQSQALGEEIEKHIQPFAAAALKFIRKHLIDEVMRPTLLEAREGKVRSKDMGKDPGHYFHQRFLQWLETPEGQVALQVEVGNHFTEPLSPYLVAETNKMCERFDMPKGSLQIATELPDKMITKAFYGALSPAIKQLEAYALKLEISVADALVPTWVRKLVPAKLVDVGMQAWANYTEGMTDLFAKNHDLKPDERDQFVTAIRAQIKKQLEARAAQIERLLR